MRGRTSSIKISLTSEQRETKELAPTTKTPVGLAKHLFYSCRGERFSQTSERVGLGERHLRSGQDASLSGVLKDCKTVPDRVESRFFPLKWRCIW